MNNSHLKARDVEAYALSTLAVAPKARSQEGQDQRNHRFGATWRHRLADCGAVFLVAGVGLALTGLLVALGYGEDLAQAFVVAG